MLCGKGAHQGDRYIQMASDLEAMTENKKQPTSYHPSAKKRHVPK